jgi:hypothetical protein
MPWSEQKYAVGRHAELYVILAVLVVLGSIAMFCGPSQ